ncbi:MAG: DNA gyrase/topoisomerase IV subunit A, partial [Flavisolibacter sp.]
LYPDFPNGAMADVADYNQGMRGGRVKVRAHIDELDKKTLLIKSVPYGVTTSGLMESIVKANDGGKIKIKKVTDNTAADVEIQVDLAPGISPDITIDALYKFTDCEVSVSPNTCVIIDQKPHFVTVNQLLKVSADNTKNLLQRELEIKLSELQEKWHYTSLEKIFFEEKIYKELEKKHETWDKVIAAIDKAFAPYTKQLKRAVTREDILKLTEKPVRRIYKLDIDDLNAQIKDLEAQIKEVKYNLANLNEYAIAYFEGLLKKYGKGKERKTEIKAFEVIEAKHVAIANTRLYINRDEGFIGTSLRKDEFLLECSDLDDIIAFTKRGTMKVVKVQDKVFIGKDILHAAVFRKGDERTTYNMIYTDGGSGITFAKRFNVTGVTRDKEYDLTKGHDKSRVHYLTVNPNGEAEVVRVVLSPNCSARIKEFEFFFEEQEIKSRNSIGNQVTKYPVRSVKFKEAGVATLGSIKLWFDDKFGRLNHEGKGIELGDFDAEDKILVLFTDGTYEITDQELTQRFNTEEVMLIEKFDPERVITAVYLDQEKLQYNVKRFKIETTTLRSKFLFIKEGKGNILEAVSTEEEPLLKVQTGKGSQVRNVKFKLAKVVEVMGWKAVGAKLLDYSKSVMMEWEAKGGGSKQPELF